MNRAVLPAVLLLFVGACADTAEPPRPYKDALIQGVPHIEQKPDFCGEACAAMVLRKLGHAVDQDFVFDQAALDPARARGCHTAELARALKRIGFQIGDVWRRVRVAKIDREMEAQWRALHADLIQGVPSIVCTRYDAGPKTTEHFRLILGYDGKRDEVIYHEPAVAGGSYRRMDRGRFLSLWPLKYAKDEWTVIRLRLEPGRIRATPPKRKITGADFAQHIMELKKKLPGRGFTVLLEPPFVVVGDQAPERVRKWSKGTVKWACDKLKAKYFARDPDEIIDVWLFRDKASYEANTRKVFHERPTTPFGYYSSQHNALIMNIATGGGTLVHEIVHPYMRANFAACPAWFNEGLASLYEQCGERGGEIKGFTNWRLAGLQKAIRKGLVPSFKTLTGQSDSAFYRDGTGTGYAQARYLCHYLQEEKLLQKYYRAFVRNHKTDPTGYTTLQAVLGERDMDAFQEKWERHVLRLRFR